MSFNILGTSGHNHALSLNVDDWFMGFSPEAPGRCIGAVQSLPLGATRQLAGLQFFRSFYTTLSLDSKGEQGDIIGFAISTR